ncbi:peptidase domain-containing ABC transporter [Azospirillum halopraeferens]|uniref:peptidase domain-containing ABC transporter n=1 Tax=Azospirillum halopraeferens TaxID=34010 RepID=UPI001FDF9FBF|nr:peptidase domain-containing ABC transporter [Azospirillum halopraeferens]
MLIALQMVAREHGIDLSPQQIDRDYALDSGDLTSGKVVRIANENGLVARTTRLTWRQLARLGQALPVVLRMRNGSAMVLVKYEPGNAGRGDTVLLRSPHQPDDTCIAVDEVRLAAAWDGEAIFVKRRHKQDIDDRPFGFPWLFQQIYRDRKIFRSVLIAGMMMSIFAIVPPFLYLVVVDRVLVYQRVSTLEVLIGGILFLILFDTLFGFLRRHLLSIGTARVDARINTAVFNRLVRLPMDFFEQTPTGTVSYKINEIWRVRSFITEQVFGVMLDLMTLLVIIPAMFVLSPGLTFVVLGIGALMCLVVVLYFRPLGAAQQRVIAAEVEKGSFLIEVLHGMRTVKSLALEGRKQLGWDVRVAEAVRAKTAFMQLGNQPQTILQPLEKLIYTGVLMLGAYLAITEQSTILAGTLVAFSMLASRATAPLMQIVALLQQIEEVRGAMAQVGSVVNQRPEQEAGAGVRPAIAGAITLTDVRFRYPGAVPFALDGVSLSIEPGSIVGIMGRSGSGKTTITRLLQGLHQSYDGLIKLNGIDLRQFDLNHLRSNLGVVLQDNFLFRGTIRDNIKITRPSATFDEVIEAARLSGAEEFIDRLPRGYDTPIEEGGANLSGGQRQRLAIARALIGNPALLIFDEATSALDPDSEAIINNNLKRIARGRTVIVISHRLASLLDCDQIIVLEQGKVYATGRHDSLLRTCDIYRHLWFQQNRHLSSETTLLATNSVGVSHG